MFSLKLLLFLDSLNRMDGTKESPNQNEEKQDEEVETWEDFGQRDMTKIIVGPDVSVVCFPIVVNDCDYFISFHLKVGSNS